MNFSGDCLLSEKLHHINTSFVTMRPLTVNDVEFIYSLRRSARAAHMKPISDDIEDQYRFFSEYETRFLRGDEIYYLITDRNTASRVGVVRLTHITNPLHFGWESMITIPEVSGTVVIDVFCTVYYCGFEILKREYCRSFEVPKKLHRVVALHKQMGLVELVEENEEYFKYQIPRDHYFKRIGWLRRLGFGNVEVVVE